jgi:hypothetical protein
VKNLHIHNRQEINPELSENGVDWRTVSPEELENLLKQLNADRTGCIIYSRENPSGNLSSRAQEIFNIIEAARLPIRLVEKKGSDGSGESERDGEGSYANCLLVTLAKSAGSVTVLESGKAVPDLEHLATNPNELSWIRGLPFDYGRLKADFVIHVILGATREPFGNNRLIRARMVLTEGKSEMVRFMVKQTGTAERGQRVEIARMIDS